MSQDDNKANVPAIPRQSKLEKWLQLGKAGADIFGAAVPILGPTLSCVLGTKIDALREERINKFLHLLAEYHEAIPMQIINSDDFSDAIRVGLSNYVAEGDAKKRQFILNLNRSLFTILAKDSNSSPFPIYLVFNDFFDQLSLPALDCLVQFKKKFKIKASRYDIVKFFNELHGIHGKRAFMELMNNALLEEEGAYEMPPSFSVDAKKANDTTKEKAIGQRMYQIQPLGALFVDWLNTDFQEQPENKN